MYLSTGRDHLHKHFKVNLLFLLKCGSGTRAFPWDVGCGILLKTLGLGDDVASETMWTKLRVDFETCGLEDLCTQGCVESEMSGTGD